jgi:hypothetical protein
MSHLEPTSVGTDSFVDAAGYTIFNLRAQNKLNSYVTIPFGSVIRLIFF